MVVCKCADGQGSCGGVTKSQVQAFSLTAMALVTIGVAFCQNLDEDDKKIFIVGAATVALIVLEAFAAYSYYMSDSESDDRSDYNEVPETLTADQPPHFNIEP